MQRITTQFCLGIALFVATTSCYSSHHFHLPDIGDPSYSAMSLSQEKKIGRVILTQINDKLKLIEDIELNHYLRSLGLDLLSAEHDRNIDYQFLLVDDSRINAFAVPGGVIAMNSGLINAADSESEVAGVVAHEIAHVTRRHIPRLYALSNKTQWVSTLGILLSLIAGAYNPDVGHIGIAAAASKPIERRLSYSRAFEREADHFGMDRLYAAGYNPAGMVQFFAKLQARRNASQIPEFLRTHPLGIDRLNDMQNRMRSYPPKAWRKGAQFAYRQAALRGILETTTNNLDEAPHIRDYRKGIELIHRGFPEKATRSLQRIAAREAQNPIVQLALARTFMLQNRARKAKDILDQLSRTSPYQLSTNYYRAKLFLQTDQSKQAFTILQGMNELRPYYPAITKLSAQAAAQLDKIDLHHEYLGDYHAATGKLELALRQYKLAEKLSEPGSVVRSRVDYKRESVIALQKEIKKR